MPDLQNVALPIYLDNAASTAVRPEVLEAMLPFFSGEFANPSAHHAHGRAAHEALEAARNDVADVFGAVTEEIVFTSGGTESINAAIKGVALAQMEAGVGRHVITTEIEHHAVLHSAQYLGRFGFDVELLPVDEFGRVTPEQVAAAVRDDTVLVSICYANNEVGTVQPLAAISAAIRERAGQLGRRIPLHTDAVQVANTHALNVDALGVDLLSLSGHKFGGPKGTGLLYLRRDVPFLEQVSGGGQERQRRSGTENVPGIVGISRALQLAQSERDAFVQRTSALRDRLLHGIMAACPTARLNGHPTERLPHNLHICFPEVEGESVVDALDAVGIECSAGAACTSATWEPSHVLLAMGVPLDLAIGSLRMTLWPSLTVPQIDYVATQIPIALERLRAAPPPRRLRARSAEGTALPQSTAIA
ncbi:MAG: cysteine desulfurase [Chloroflexi bacterium]|nr:MAG: cysteine desulfurase [Chloroflexota bacterium]